MKATYFYVKKHEAIFADILARQERCRYLNLSLQQVPDTSKSGSHLLDVQEKLDKFQVQIWNINKNWV